MARPGFRRLLTLSPLLLVALSLLTGCGRSVSKAQADRIKLGMTVADVQDVLGKGKAVDSGEVDRLMKSAMPEGGGAAGGAKVEIDTSELRGEKWGDDKKWITVLYKNEKVFRVFTQGL